MISAASGSDAVMPVDRPDRAERGHRLEEHAVERQPGDDHERDRRGHDRGDRQQHDRDRLTVHGARESLAEDVHGALAAQLGRHDEEQHRERGDLDAARGAGRTAADEHQHVHAEPRLVAHQPDVDGVESGGARLHRVEEADQDARCRVVRAERLGVRPLEAPDEHRAADEQQRRSPRARSSCSCSSAADRRNSLRSCMMTGNPRPPRMIAAHIGRQIHGSVAKPIRLSLYSAKPALLNDDTEWKRACQAASPGL